MRAQREWPLQQQPVFGIPADPELQLVFRRLANGAPVDDNYFDRIYPEAIRRLSRTHWTPLPVIRRAVELLTRGFPRARVLDAGSGAGKFCLAGAALSPAEFVGIEQRPHFVELSRGLSARYGLQRAVFLQKNIFDEEWSEYDAVYLFNPFQEHKTPWQRIDSSIQLHFSIFREHAGRTEEKLSRMRRGARVVTYHGFGGTVPESFERITREFCHRGMLECWQKTL